MKTIKVMNAHAVDLAVEFLNDATGFVQIMEANHLEDWAIGAPVLALSSANNLAGDTVLVLPPTVGITLGMLVYCPGYDTYGLVADVTNIYDIPVGTPFAQGYADVQALFPDASRIGWTMGPAPIPIRIMPPQGNLVSTNVTVTPPLDNLMPFGSAVTFAVAAPSEVLIPDIPPGSRGKP